MSRITTNVTEQLDLLELQLRVARLFLVEAQERSLFRLCRVSQLKPCLLCRVKQYILRERFN